MALNTLQRISKNALVLLASQVVGRVSTFLIIIFIARHLGDVGLGRYAFALSFTTLFVIISEVGLRDLIIREVARDRSLAGKYIHNATVIKFFSSALAFGLIALVINLLRYPEETRFAVYILGASLILSSTARLLNSLFNAYERMEFESVSFILERIFAAGAGILVLLLGYGLRGVVLAVLMGSVLNLVLSLFLTSRKIVRPALEFDWDFWKDMIKKAWPFGVVYVFVIIYFQIDTVMLSLMKGDSPVGWYNAAYKIIFALQVIPVAFLNSLFPLMSRYFVSPRDSLKEVFERSFKYLFILALPIAVGATLTGEKIIWAFYGKEFVPSIVPFKILIWASSSMFIRHLFGTVMGSIDRQHMIARLAGRTTAFNVVLNLVLIPLYGHTGAASATVATEALGLVLFFLFLSRHFHRLPLFRLTARPVAASLLMGAFVILSGKMNLILQVFLSAVVYFAALLALRTFGRNEAALFRGILGRD
jgi:O-antigen/teichoic acid export membrane protein